MSLSDHRGPTLARLANQQAPDICLNLLLQCPHSRCELPLLSFHMDTKVQTRVLNYAQHLTEPSPAQSLNFKEKKSKYEFKNNPGE